MSWNRRGKRVATTVLVMVISIAMLTLTLGATASASARGTTAVSPALASHHTIVVLPTGSDDTSDIQAAFNACVSFGAGCTVQLVKGTYYTGQIAVTGFQGSFVGAGQGRTVIQALPNLASPTADPFWAAAPGPTNPWPDLFTFVNGAFRVSQMTIVDTYFNPVPNGWDNFGTPATYLWADIMVTGEQANAAFDDFTLVTGPGTFNIGIGTPSSFDSSGGLVYEGMLATGCSGFLDCFEDQIPVSGTFSVTNSYLYGTDSAVWAENTLDASVTISSNSITSSPSMIALADLSNTQVWVYANQMTNVMYAGGVIASQSVFKYDLLPSTIYVTGNYIESNWFGSGVWVQDYGPSEGLASTLSVVATGNDFVFDNGCGCAYLQYAGALGAVNTTSAILSGNTVIQGGWGVDVSGGPATVSGNLILGTYVGVYLGYYWGAASYIHVTGNVIKNSVDFGIAVVGGSSGNIVSYNLVKGSGLYDLYWDGTGTGNVWMHNVCSTSSPPGLC